MSAVGGRPLGPFEVSPNMRSIGQFVLVTFLRGVLFLVPIVLVAILAREAYQMIRKAFEPIAQFIPNERIIGVLTEDFLSIAAISLVFLIAGLFVATRPGQRLNDHLEKTVLYRVPGYLLVRGAFGGFPGLTSGTRPEPALVEMDDGWAFALLVERSPHGFCTVFLLDAPTPTSGSIRIVESSRVRPLNESILTLLGCLTRSGTGALAIAEKVLPAIAEAETTQANS